MSSLSIPAAFELALQHHQAGRLPEAEALYRQILNAQPGQPDALHLLGVVAHRSGRPEIAVELIQQALNAAPQHVAAHFNLGNALSELGRMEEAADAFGRATELQPDYAQAHHNLGSALAKRGRFDEAIAAFQRAIELKPDYASAYNNLGLALKAQARRDEALAAFQQAIALQPDHAEAHFNLGNIFREWARPQEAMTAFRRALEINPDYADALNNLGITLADAGRLDEAIACYRRALQINPAGAETNTNLGNALFELQRLDEAAAAFRAVIELKPDLAQAYNNLGNALREQGALNEASAEFLHALAIEPNSADFHNNLGNALKDRGEIDAALDAYRRAMELAPDDSGPWTNFVYTLLFQPRVDDRALIEARAQWSNRFADPLRPFIRPHTNDRSPERRLRIGYVSPNFRRHVVGVNLLPLFRHHDHTAFEIYCYDNGVRVDSFHEEIRRGADHWRSSVGVSDEALAEMIRQDGVDILVDLTQHMAGNRLQVLARRPAPVQVSFAGYPETTGLEAIDYRISDRFLDVGAPRHEQVVHIDSFWCYAPAGDIIEVSDSSAKQNGIVTFGSLNNFCKVNDPMLQLWARVLRGVKGSRLVLLSHAGTHRQRTLDILTEAGIDPSRIEFATHRPRPKYLELYRHLDVVLDPFPYNGHTTSLDALWMGVPVVTLAGKTAVSRAGLSQLSNLGLPELVAFTGDDYVAKAIQLAHDLPRLAELRRTLRGRMEASVLMDAPRFARNIENAYRTMWQKWCAAK
ncbi:TPR repeat-containing protein [Chthoniobacter flavus Ellin428]|uniref:protein O-GlcNAc transferase n=1 Tax=Chthoniobacter flavus Ellin428 TaxID=497964 RepID=B4D9Q4_9BACT|nr:glycosyltransferase family 41 protein [Chthoniobacter flavus]EDY16835.1 TPR repeat-containing protein [Chthoniobacter flavus Ellin428]TCO93342.1 putative O-linked N-acetylglucosamine transferase (SPINDLY family) [Chthoniobacter flavus]